ncbi:hypothetical protein AXF42_Ash010869 [Apostasia shenzhenica]|uniref:Uncharacterized protein n=1 Tax=Apostasia shenzhenica TaxID=1088818 RepID=A0A2I0A0X1_9ASPA|nr:hypothetical protein AXF42_Ash010869 [Apostasia shenzhenica]
MAFITSSSKPSPTIFQTLDRALKLLCQSSPLSFPLLLFSILTSSLLFISNFLSVAPIAKDLLSKLLPFFSHHHPSPFGPDFPKQIAAIISDARRLAAAQSPFSIAAFSLSLLLLIAAVHAFSAAYTGEPLTLPSLLQKIKIRWYQTLITQLYILILTIGFAVVSSAVIASVHLWENSPLVDGISGSLFTAAASLYIYLRSRWWLSLVITVVEKKETYGIGALSWAVELFYNNVRRGMTITVLDLAGAGTIAAGYFVAMGSAREDLEMQIKITSLTAAAGVVWGTVITAVYTVFYFECRESFSSAVDGMGYGFSWEKLRPLRIGAGSSGMTAIDV